MAIALVSKVLKQIHGVNPTLGPLQIANAQSCQALGKQKQVNLYEFEVSLSKGQVSRQLGLHREDPSQKQNKKKKQSLKSSHRTNHPVIERKKSKNQMCLC